jgi:tRNA pseudouridine38-40 synthase
MRRQPVYWITPNLPFSASCLPGQDAACRIFGPIWNVVPSVGFLPLRPTVFYGIWSGYWWNITEVGLGKMDKDLQAVVEARDRQRAGTSVAAKGLFLVDIGYPSSLFLSD